MIEVQIHMTQEQCDAVNKAHAKFIEPGIWSTPKWVMNMMMWAQYCECIK